MTSPLHRSPRLALSAILVAAAAVACSDGASTSTGSYHGGHLGSASGSTGTPSDGSSSSTGNGGSTNNGATAGGNTNPGPSETGSQTGNTDPGTGNGTGTGTGTGNGTGNGTGTGTGNGTGNGNGTGTGTGTTNGSFDVLVDNASPAINLADETDVQVTVAPQAFTGNVTLSVTGLPADVTATFDPPSVSVSGTTGATAKLALKSASTTAPGALALKVVGTSGAATKETALTPTVKSIITIKIPVNVDANTGPNVFGTITIKAPTDIANNPVTVNFLNLDSTPHEIHASNPAQGFPHGSGTFAQNKTDKPRNVTATGSYKFYLHDEGSAKTPGTIVIQ